MGTPWLRDQFVECARIQLALADLMTLLALPGTAELELRIVGFYYFKANWANEDPFLCFADTNAISYTDTLSLTRGFKASYPLDCNRPTMQ